ncbi:hypothetical protein P7K49_004466 [Saguinus oedipus]|uniref:Uncharacterized protein n=1 Tax=Saguinus oedipus TaxID=9490 RepID=A0ABQ9W7W1_SAGOE|nr:hypothetical protein P7K49_004466 [Saguinus oedipus]
MASLSELHPGFHRGSCKAGHDTHSILSGDKSTGNQGSRGRALGFTHAPETQSPSFQHSMRLTACHSLRITDTQRSEPLRRDDAQYTASQVLVAISPYDQEGPFFAITRRQLLQKLLASHHLPPLNRGWTTIYHL